MEQEHPLPLHTTLKDSRFNFRLGTGDLQVKVDYRADLSPKAPPLAPPIIASLLPMLTQQALLGDKEAMVSACASWIKLLHRTRP